MAVAVEKESLPISSLCCLSLSLSLSLSSAPLLFSFAFILYVATCSTHLTVYPVALSSMPVHPLRGNLSRSCHAHASQPPTKLPKEKPQSSTLLLFTSTPHHPLPKKTTHKCTEIQAALVLFLSSATLSSGVLQLEKPGELEADLLFSSQPCTSRLRTKVVHRNTHEILFTFSVWVILNTLAD